MSGSSCQMQLVTKAGGQAENAQQAKNAPLLEDNRQTHLADPGHRNPKAQIHKWWPKGEQWSDCRWQPLIGFSIR